MTREFFFLLVMAGRGSGVTPTNLPYIIKKSKVKSRFDNSMGNLQPSTSTW